MTGLYIHPDVMHMEVPGQVPKLDPDIDTPAYTSDGRLTFTVGSSHGFDFSAGEPVASEDVVVQNLGLEPGAASFVRSLVSRELGASNEITFRQSVMTSLIEQRFPPNLRRSILARAVKLYRAGRPDRPRSPFEKGGHGDGAHLQSKIRDMIADGGDLGLPTKALAEFVRKHGSQAVVAALKALGIQHHSGRIFLHKSEYLVDSGESNDGNDRARTREMTCYVIKAEIEQVPRGARAAGGGSDDRSDPPGSRKIWNKRIVEKQPDGKWHVVGHVAGLEDPKAVPQLDTSILTREHLLDLLRQLVKVHQAENGKPEGATK